MRRHYPLLTALFVPIALLLAVEAITTSDWLYYRELDTSPISNRDSTNSLNRVTTTLKLEYDTRNTYLVLKGSGKDSPLDRRKKEAQTTAMDPNPTNFPFHQTSDEDSPGNIIYYHPTYTI